MPVRSFLTVVIHSVLAPVEAAALPGERVTVAYTPADAAIGFGVTWWRPDGGDRRVTATRPLATARPHLDARDREDVLASGAGECGPSRSSPASR